MTDSTQWAAATAQYMNDRTAALEYSDLQAAPDTVTRERQRLLDAAGQRLAAATPPAPTTGAPSRTEVLSARLPRTADAVAAQGREWEKVEALLVQGRSLGTIVAQADETRLAAILDYLETMPGVLSSSDPEGIVAELNARAFDRLVEIGAPDAVAVANAEAAIAVPRAWHDVMPELLVGNVSLGARTQLHRNDILGYDAVIANMPDADDALRRQAVAVLRIGLG